MSTRMTTSQKKSTVLTVGIVALLLVAFALCSAMTAGFTDWEPKMPTVNPDNLYSTVDLEIVDSNTGYGIAVNVDETTGAIELDGTATDDLDYVVGTVTLNKGTYTLTSSNKTSKAGVYVTATSGDSETFFDFTPYNVIEVTADNTVYTITIHINEGTTLNHVDILPVIASGEDTVSFYE